MMSTKQNFKIDEINLNLKENLVVNDEISGEENNFEQNDEELWFHGKKNRQKF